MKGALTRWTLGFAAVAALACGRNRATTDVDPNAETKLLVDNQAFPDMTIYVLEGGRRVRLGMAGGNSQTRFTLPKYIVRTLTSIRFLADPIGGNRTPVSQEIQVSPGDEVTLRIPPS
jgi:hypothetical protein